MYKRSLLIAALGVLFGLGSSAVTYAQSCQNQTCQVNSQGMLHLRQLYRVVLQSIGYLPAKLQ
jgi:hypothetical protein